MEANDLIFALDIGTRTIIGVVGIEEDGKFKIIASETIEHKSRAMMDGQVHDIEKVAEVAAEVKNKLEEKLGIKLNKVAIAAAGRVLKTKQVHVDMSVNPENAIEKELISSLEMEGIQLAQYELDEELSKSEKVMYYCVGYSVVNYYLNNYVISSLVGHKGKSIGADIIGTFLPHTVVDSLYSVMNRVGLEVVSLTLEPIAAINVAIPKDLRLLNLALVDVGAGTSDIAITKDGAVVGYEMVPVAGDEITEAICHNYIVDFNTAEKIKISLSSSKTEVKFTDVMGLSRRIKVSEIKEVIRPAVEHLADMISQKIIEFNGKSTNAVFLIGGGSQAFELDRLLAEKLNLPKERVAVRKRNVIQNVKVEGKFLSGPDAITPIGIAVTASIQRGSDFISVSVNGTKVRLFNSKNLYVSDALILAGFKPSELIGRNGKSITFELNGKPKTVKGEYGKAAEITVNNEIANLQTLLINGDNIYVKPAENGGPASITADELSKSFEYECEIIVNGNVVEDRYYIQNDDRVEVLNKSYINGPVKESDNYNTEESIETEEVAVSITEKTQGARIVINVNQEDVVIEGIKSEYIFVDIFDYYHFDINVPGKKLVMTLNGVQASFTDRINQGDKVEIYWV